MVVVAGGSHCRRMAVLLFVELFLDDSCGPLHHWRVVCDAICEKDDHDDTVEQDAICIAVDDDDGMEDRTT